MKRFKIYIGTSGWHYDHWKGIFYDEKLSSSHFLKEYVKQFQSVEINNTFYRLPTKSSIASWKKSVPKGFVFSVKASRFITHIKHLKNVEKQVKLFDQLVKPLGAHLGPVLFQLPPTWNVNIKRLETFLSQLPSQRRYAFEFRDKRWINETVLFLLKEYGAAFCIHDYGGVLTPIEVTSSFVYLRFHGPSGYYSGRYSKSFLKKWAKQIKEWQTTKKDVYCYFNNDERAYATVNAKELLKLLQDL